MIAIGSYQKGIHFKILNMRFIYLSLLLFIGNVIFAQNINQFDENGKRHGVWKKNFDDTKVIRFEGEFSHGKEIGLFKFYKNINNKAVLSATREFSEIDSKAKVTFFASNGKVISEGNMKGKIYVGEWKYYQKNSDKLLTLEHYDDKGNLTGERFIYYKNGQISQKEHYKDGKLDGVSVWYSENNTLLKEFVYAYGVLHGLSKYYSPKGELIIEGLYGQGKKIGVWNYYEGGKLVDEKNFSN